MNTVGNAQFLETDQRIKETFIFLLSHKGITKISIQDICRHAGISRTTFYVHFKDIYELMENLEIEHAKKTLSFFVERETDEVIVSKANFLRFLQYVKDNKPFFQYLYSHSNNACDLVKHDILNILGHIGLESEEGKYTVTLIVGGINRMIKRWLEEDCSTPSKKLIDLIFDSYTFFHSNL